MFLFVDKLVSLHLRSQYLCALSPLRSKACFHVLSVTHSLFVIHKTCLCSLFEHAKLQAMRLDVRAVALADFVC